MNLSPSDDSLLERLSRLPAAAPDPQHDARVRQRCHASLAKRYRGPSYRLTGPSRRPIEVALVGTFSALYLGAILYDAVRVYMP